MVSTQWAQCSTLEWEHQSFPGETSPCGGTTTRVVVLVMASLLGWFLCPRASSAQPQGSTAGAVCSCPHVWGARGQPCTCALLQDPCMLNGQFSLRISKHRFAWLVWLCYFLSSVQPALWSWAVQFHEAVRYWASRNWWSHTTRGCFQKDCLATSLSGNDPPSCSLQYYFALSLERKISHLFPLQLHMGQVMVVCLKVNWNSILNINPGADAWQLPSANVFKWFHLTKGTLPPPATTCSCTERRKTCLSL